MKPQAVGDGSSVKPGDRDVYHGGYERHRFASGFAFQQKTELTNQGQVVKSRFGLVEQKVTLRSLGQDLRDLAQPDKTREGYGGRLLIITVHPRERTFQCFTHEVEI